MAGGKEECVTDAKSWEERVIALERELEQRTAALADLERAHAESSAKVVELEAAVQAHREAEQARREAEQVAYVEGLKQRACEFQSPIPESDLEKVRAAFAKGDAETARLLGDAFLARSEARGGQRTSTTETVTLGSDRKIAAEVDEDIKRLRARLGLPQVKEQ